MFSSLMYIFLYGTFMYAIYYMMSNSRNRFQDHQGKAISLFMVIFIVGVILIMTSYNGILQLPLQAIGLYKGNVEPIEVSKVTTQDNSISSVRFEADVVEDHTVTKQVTKHNFFYGVMFDAGSTGSRVHVFKFKKTEPGKPFELEDALFQFNSKGLSSFKDDPLQGAESLRPLLDNATKYVPEDQRSHTPIALKATAGLRLLPEEQSKALLDHVRQLFKASPFMFEEQNVKIMEGDDEGFFSWFTLNFLKGFLGNKDKMIGAMDLGGGSTQITFVPTITTQETSPIELEEVDLFGNKFKIYSHSYLGLGLMAGRYQTLGGTDIKNDDNDDNGNTVFISSCLLEGQEEKWRYNEIDYTVKGKKTENGSRFDACHGAAEDVVKKYKMHNPPELKSLPFTVFSYYYDRAVDAQLIDESQGGVVKVEDFLFAARKECDTPKGKPFLCLDLCYISALFEDGFQFDMKTELSLQKKVNGFEISWALGAMFNLLKEEE